MSVILMWGETVVPGVNPPVQSGDKKPSHVSVLGLKPG